MDSVNDEAVATELLRELVTDLRGTRTAMMYGTPHTVARVARATSFADPAVLAQFPREVGVMVCRFDGPAREELLASGGTERRAALLEAVAYGDLYTAV